MGTQKKLVLASVVSMMLVLAFMVGFVPSHDADQTGATASDGRVDMAGLLDMVLGDKAITAIVPASPAKGLTFTTPVTNYQQPYIPVSLTSAATGTGGDVFYVIDPANATGFNIADNGLPFWGGETDQFTGPVLPPTFPGSFDLGSRVPATPALTNYAINAIANINQTYTNYEGFANALYYGVTSYPANQVLVDLDAVPGAADANGNGLPDALGSANGGAWIANVNLAPTGAPEVRTAVVRDLSAHAAGDTAIVIPVQPGLNVEVPTRQELFDAGVIGSTDLVYAIVTLTDDLSGAIDGDQAARQDWANQVLAGAPGEIIPGAPVVQIAFVALVGGVPTQLNDLGGLSAKLSLTGITDLAANADKGVAVWGVHVATDGHVLSQATDNPADAWHIGDGAPVVDYLNGTVTAELSTFSAFVPVYSEIRVTDIDPKLIPANIPDFTVPVTLTGIFPTAMAANVYAGLTADEAAANYSVVVAGALTAFRSVDTVYTGPGGVEDHTPVAVTALKTNPLVPNKMFLTLSNITVPGKATFVDVTVSSTTNPGNSFTLTATLEVAVTGEITLTTSGSGTGTVALTPPNGSLTLSDSTVINFPANTYLAGATVAASATPTGTSLFTAWSGVATGTINPIPFAVPAGASTLDAQFDLPVVNFPLTIVAPVNGAITVSPVQPVGGYPAGTVVTLTAVADPGFQFNTWTGNPVTPINATQATIVMNAPKSVGATFLAVAVTKRLTLTANTGGTVAASPLGIGGGTLYNVNDPVTITATAASNYLFDRWTGASAATLIDVTNPVQNITMDTDKEFVANFRQVLNVTAILPNSAWIFGGVVARVSGTGLGVGTKFTLGGKDLYGFNAAGDGSAIDIVIPPTDDRSDNALVITTLTASQGGATTPAIPFTYKRYFENTATGVNTTAFILDAPTVENTVKLDTGGGDITSGNVIIPGLNTSAAQVYGIVLDQKLTVAAAKSTTAPVPAGDLSASLIDDAGTPVDDTYNFSIFLYTAAPTKATTPPAQNAIYVDATATLAATLGQGADAQGIPNAGTAMKVTLPLAGSGVNYADVRTGLAMWGIEAQYDYASNVESFTDPKVEEYQSELLLNEVDPNLAVTTPDADQPDQMLKARVYSLNGFGLRKGWALPADIAAGVRLAKVDGAAVSGAGSGPKAGGTVLTLVSPKGGLGYVDRIVMRAPAKCFGKLGGTATQTLFVAQPGTDEYVFEFKTPKSGKAGVVDIVVYLKSSPETPAVVLDKAFEYKAKSVNLTPLLLILLGVVLAIIGIAAGVDSGGDGGGGGPCFIATAAYGTPLVAEIDTLRAVRDTYLLDNAVGSAFVDAYYRVSPTIADAVAQSPVLAAVVRLLLVPVIFLGKLALLMPAPMVLLALAVGTMCFLRRRSRGRA